MSITQLHPADQKIIKDRIAAVVTKQRGSAERAVEEVVARHLSKVGSGNHTGFSDLDAGIDRVFENYPSSR